MALGWVCVITVLLGCTSRTDVHTTEFLAMGTTMSVSVAAVDAAAATTAIAEVQALVQRLGREWYPWTPDGSGELAQLNAALARGESAAVSPELADLLVRSREIAAASDSAFDPAVGGLVEVWGFNDAERTTHGRPAPEDIGHWQHERPSIADLIVDGNSISSRRTDIKLDLGAIAKGRVVDMATDVLRRHGIASALVNAGGNMRALGTAPGRPWRIAIRNPRSDGMIGWLALEGGDGISTSGDYERFDVVDGQRLHHILDPRSGEPATHTAAITVVMPDATLADAASTALFTAGPDHWQEVATRLGVKQVLRVTPEGRIQITRSLRQHLHLDESVSAESITDIDL